MVIQHSLFYQVLMVLLRCLNCKLLLLDSVPLPVAADKVK